MGKSRGRPKKKKSVDLEKVADHQPGITPDMLPPGYPLGIWPTFESCRSMGALQLASPQRDLTDTHQMYLDWLQAIAAWARELKGDRGATQLVEAMDLLGQYMKQVDESSARFTMLALGAGMRAALLRIWPEERSLRTGKKVLAGVKMGGEAAHERSKKLRSKDERYRRYREEISRVRTRNPGMSWNSVYEAVQRRLAKDGLTPSKSTLYRAHRAKEPTD